ncbi:hypothetical protein PP1Y_AT3411 [Novosphingobium sp. PP1Y]|nr:hypothetical protein PP1Y_AT3411 [Novosphingobium sp. PP1Y]
MDQVAIRLSAVHRSGVGFGGRPIVIGGAVIRCGVPLALGQDGDGPGEATWPGGADRFHADHELMPAGIGVAAMIVDLPVKRRVLAHGAGEGLATAGRAGDVWKLRRAT